MDDPHVLHPGHAPTPFTAAQIRRGCPPGRTVTARTEAMGEPDRVDVTVFVDADDAGALLESNGRRHRMSWLELQDQASFPAEATTITEDIVEIPLGRLECLSYRVATEGTASTFWFAKDRPGMPVLFTTETDQVLVSTTFVIEDEVVTTAST